MITEINKFADNSLRFNHKVFISLETISIFSLQYVFLLTLNLKSPLPHHVIFYQILLNYVLITSRFHSNCFFCSSVIFMGIEGNHQQLVGWRNMEELEQFNKSLYKVHCFTFYLNIVLYSIFNIAGLNIVEK